MLAYFLKQGVRLIAIIVCGLIIVDRYYLSPSPNMDDDWMDFADKDPAELKKVDAFADEAKLLEQKPQEAKPAEQQSEKAPEEKQEKQEKQEKVVPSKPAEKARPLTNEEKRKAELLSRLNEERLIDDLFEGISAQNKQYTAAQILLKKEQDFFNFAKTVAKRFEEDTDSELIEDFSLELLINLFRDMKSKDLQIIWDKLKVLKTEKKKDDKDKEKKKKKEVVKKQTKEAPKVQEAKEVEKPKQSQPAAKPRAYINRNDDADDFM